MATENELPERVPKWAPSLSVVLRTGTGPGFRWVQTCKEDSTWVGKLISNCGPASSPSDQKNELKPFSLPLPRDNGYR